MLLRQSISWQNQPAVVSVQHIALKAWTNTTSIKELKIYRNRNSEKIFLYVYKSTDFIRLVYLYFKWDSCECSVCVFYMSRSTSWVERLVVAQKRWFEQWETKKTENFYSNPLAFDKNQHFTVFWCCAVRNWD